MKRYCNEQNCQNEKIYETKQCQYQDADDLVRRGQHLHDAAVCTALSYLMGLARKMFSVGHTKDYPPVRPEKNRRGWAA